MSNKELIEGGHEAIDADAAAMGKSAYLKYMNRVVATVEDLQPGERIDIAARSTAKTRGRFVRALWLFIQSGGEAIFSDDYRYLIRCTPVPAPQSKERAKKKGASRSRHTFQEKNKHAK